MSSHAILNTMILERSIKENVLERTGTIQDALERIDFIVLFRSIPFMTLSLERAFCR